MLGSIPYCYFSFGGGVQSCAIYLMLMHEPHKLIDVMGEYPDKVFFADTSAELQATYEALKHMQSYNSKLYAIEVVSNGDITREVFADNLYKPKMPYFYVANNNKVGMHQRQCTSDFKVKALLKAARAAFNLTNKSLKHDTISIWLGISTDEERRAQPSKENGFVNRYPLIELGWSRDDCEVYCKEHGWIPVKSRCYCCPYQSEKNWLDLKLNHSEDFKRACEIDEKCRNATIAKFGYAAYLHRSCLPLSEVKFKGESEVNGFGWECDGLCGV